MVGNRLLLNQDFEKEEKDFYDLIDQRAPNLDEIQSEKEVLEAYFLGEEHSYSKKLCKEHFWKQTLIEPTWKIENKRGRSDKIW